MQDSAIPEQSHGAIKREARLKNQGLKQFGGKLTGFADNRERHFYQRMLRAYIKGAPQFQFGFEKNADGKRIIDLLGNPIPVWHPVQLIDKTFDFALNDALLAKGYNDPGKVFGGASNNNTPTRKKIKERIKEIKRIEREVSNVNFKPFK